MKILHDYDNAYPSGRWALRRGCQLVLYALSRKFSFLRRYCEDVYDECFQYAETLARLDNLLGIRSIFAFKDGAFSRKDFKRLSTVTELVSASGHEMRKHWHVSKVEVHWEPELNIPRQDWWFDKNYAKQTVQRPKGDYAVFHADYPELLGHYIRFLSEMKAGKTL